MSTQQKKDDLQSLQEQIESLQGRLENHRYNNDRLLLRTEGMLQECRSRCSELEQEAAEWHTAYDRITATFGWQLLKRFHAGREKLLPAGSPLRKLYDKGRSGVRIWRQHGTVALLTRAEQLFSGSNLPQPEPAPTAAELGRQLSFPRYAAEEVEVSIIIPVYNKWELTRLCLASLQNSSSVKFEVIVVDNNSSDETAEFLAAVDGLHVISNTENKVFVEGCNQGAVTAVGRYLLFLNNDTEVRAGWIEAMLDPFSDPRVGAVGAKLIYPDGRLQEAGSIIWQDGTGWNYGCGENQYAPQYCYRREVDYCSGACLLLPRSLWDQIGGFDTRYAPAYYEDTDLCFSVRAMGYKVVYEPEAWITHYGGASAGTDLTSGYKKYQEINREKFVEKWKGVLKEQAAGPEQLYFARERGKKKQILIIDHYVPTFDKDSGSVRMFNILRILTSMGHKVVFWPDNGKCDVKYVLAMQRLGVETMYETLDFEKFIKENGICFDAIFLSRPTVAANYIHLVRESAPQAKLIYDTVDLHYLREERRMALEVEKLKKLEFDLAAASDATLVVSPVEQKLLQEEAFGSRVQVLSNIHEVTGSTTPFASRKGAIFIGGFAHPPNSDGVLWFVEEVLPLILEQIPGFHFTVIGSNPPEEISRLASDSVTVTGYVPEVDDYFETARLFVSPLRYGAGVKGKIGQSFSLGLPVVTTSVGAEGMDIVDGVHALVADTATDFARATIHLYEDEQLWQSLAANAGELLERKFGFSVAEQMLSRLLKGT